MKERDIDREEMAAQTILFQKNIEQVIYLPIMRRVSLNRRNFLICVYVM